MTDNPLMKVGGQTLGETSKLRVQVSDSRGASFVEQVYTAINVDDDPDLYQKLLAGELNVAHSPRDGIAHSLAISVLVIWPREHRAVLYIPADLAHQALQIRAEFLERLDDESLVPSYMEDFVPIVGLGALKEHLKKGFNREPSKTGFEVFRGALGSTMMRPVTVQDDSGRSFSITLYTSVNCDEDGDLLAELQRGELNIVVSPFDHSTGPIPLPVILHKPSRSLFMLLIPRALKARRFRERAKLLRQLAASTVNLPRYVVNFRTVLGLRELQSIVGNVSSTKSDPTPTAPIPVVSMDSEPLIPVDRNPFIADLDEAAPESEPQDEYTAKLGLAARLRLSTSDSHHREWFNDTLPQQLSSRGLRPYLQPPDTQGLVLSWKLSFRELEPWRHLALHFLVQLHNLNIYPLIALVLAAVDDDGEVVADLYHCFDVKEPKQRAFLMHLARHFDVSAAIYDSNGALAEAARFSGPLGENLRAAIDEADRRIQQDKSLDFEAAVARFGEPSFPRIGSMRHPFTHELFQSLRLADETMLATGILSYWSQEANRRYLLFNHSFSADAFETLQDRVVNRAIELGIRLSPLLRRVAIKRERAKSAPELLKTLLENFTALATSEHNDLDAIATWENWRQLLEDADEYGIDIEPEAVNLAQHALNEVKDLEGIEEH